MRFTYLFFLLNILFFTSCKKDKLTLTKVVGKQIEITDSLMQNEDIENFVKPFRDHIQNDLDSVLAYSKNTYSKAEGEYNTAVGNFMADAIYKQANIIFNKRTSKNIDMVLLNYGGIRSIIPKGNITKKTAFNIMPFENSIVVVALKGTQVKLLIEYLSKDKTAHPISKLKLKLNKDYSINSATINGENIDALKTYYVATNDYLYNGGDSMTFFKPNDSLYELNYKIRNALIDNFKTVDTIKPVIDDRFTQIK
ncbi:5'-nucleotidase [Postechiella marina]|uniref:5'-nucleotidase n=1 Tax=Postechiella marina TaxID=943941 RepID=A0ABP8CE04_9FLAO